ncbi:MAG: DeoR/GlpR transcriptional regulator [Lachnospiraceae bacterium]|nr:DeoR/GlpR transcriptional regulator [Lachnospiraceae bacterium]
MLKSQRQDLITEELTRQGFVLISSLSEIFSCSEETIRRDLKEMERDGRLVRTHGGAYVAEQYDKSYPTDLRKTLLHSEKERLAAAALKYIQNNEFILLDSSTTCLALASALIRSKKEVTVVTNSLLICNLCNEYNSNINLICTGGVFRHRTTSFTDYHTIDFLKNYHADASFLSPPKMTISHGLSDNHLSESRVREQMIRQSDRCYLLMDHTKFGPNANILFEGIEKADVIITDEVLPPEWEAYAAEKGIALDYCK